MGKKVLCKTCKYFVEYVDNDCGQYWTVGFGCKYDSKMSKDDKKSKRCKIFEQKNNAGGGLTLFPEGGELSEVTE